MMIGFARRGMVESRAECVRFWQVGLFCALLCVMGCDPPITMDVYQAHAQGYESMVAAQATRIGTPDDPESTGEYLGWPLVRFQDRDGSVWELHMTEKYPKTWGGWV